MRAIEAMRWSAASGLLAGVNAARLCAGEEPVVPPETTALGALVRYISDPERKRFQPMNVNFGLLPPLALAHRGKAKKEMMARRALADMQAWVENHGAKAAPATAPSHCASVSAVASSVNSALGTEKGLGPGATWKRDRFIHDRP